MRRTRERQGSFTATSTCILLLSVVVPLTFGLAAQQQAVDHMHVAAADPDADLAQWNHERGMQIHSPLEVLAQLAQRSGQLTQKQNEIDVLKQQLQDKQITQADYEQKLKTVTSERANLQTEVTHLRRAVTRLESQQAQHKAAQDARRLAAKERHQTREQAFLAQLRRVEEESAQTSKREREKALLQMTRARTEQREKAERAQESLRHLRTQVAGLSRKNTALEKSLASSEKLRRITGEARENWASGLLKVINTEKERLADKASTSSRSSISRSRTRSVRFIQSGDHFPGEDEADNDNVSTDAVLPEASACLSGERMVPLADCLATLDRIASILNSSASTATPSTSSTTGRSRISSLDESCSRDDEVFGTGGSDADGGDSSEADHVGQKNTKLEKERQESFLCLQIEALTESLRSLSTSSNTSETEELHAYQAQSERSSTSKSSSSNYCRSEEELEAEEAALKQAMSDIIRATQAREARSRRKKSALLSSGARSSSTSGSSSSLGAGRERRARAGKTPSCTRAMPILGSRNSASAFAKPNNKPLVLSPSRRPRKAGLQVQEDSDESDDFVVSDDEVPARSTSLSGCTSTMIKSACDASDRCLDRIAITAKTAVRDLRSILSELAVDIPKELPSYVLKRLKVFSEILKLYVTQSALYYAVAFYTVFLEWCAQLKQECISLPADLLEWFGTQRSCFPCLNSKKTGGGVETSTTKKDESSASLKSSTTGSSSTSSNPSGQVDATHEPARSEAEVQGLLHQAGAVVALLAEPPEDKDAMATHEGDEETSRHERIMQCVNEQSWHAFNKINRLSFFCAIVSLAATTGSGAKPAMGFLSTLQLFVALQWTTVSEWRRLGGYLCFRSLLAWGLGSSTLYFIYVERNLPQLAAAYPEIFHVGGGADTSGVTWTMAAQLWLGGDEDGFDKALKGNTMSMSGESSIEDDLYGRVDDLNFDGLDFAARHNLVEDVQTSLRNAIAEVESFRVRGDDAYLSFVEWLEWTTKAFGEESTSTSSVDTTVEHDDLDNAGEDEASEDDGDALVFDSDSRAPEDDGDTCTLCSTLASPAAYKSYLHHMLVDVASKSACSGEPHYFAEVKRLCGACQKERQKEADEHRLEQEQHHHNRRLAQAQQLPPGAGGHCDQGIICLFDANEAPPMSTFSLGVHLFVVILGRLLCSTGIDTMLESDTKKILNGDRRDGSSSGSGGGGSSSSTGGAGRDGDGRSRRSRYKQSRKQKLANNNNKWK
ncbi:unnamed protein product [Amoebophrya sp. A25]|nr:unnamed protein product [Amoebophrya sp. A25]|eukprot:GSA25T00022986001.1